VSNAVAVAAFDREDGAAAHLLIGALLSAVPLTRREVDNARLRRSARS
jgi:hypothetical protein